MPSASTTSRLGSKVELVGLVVSLSVAFEHVPGRRRVRVDLGVDEVIGRPASSSISSSSTGPQTLVWQYAG